MSLTNPHGTIQQLADQILLCPAVIAKGIVDETQLWYPNMSVPDAVFPAILLTERNQTRTRYAEAAIPLISGTFTIIYFETGTDPGELETFARQLVLELGSQYYGLCFREFSVGLCSDPKPGQRAAGGNSDYRQISITVQYGLTR